MSRGSRLISIDTVTDPNYVCDILDRLHADHRHIFDKILYFEPPFPTTWKSTRLMVQDLTNPMLAQIPHVQLAAQVGTIMGVETNAMQFYPAASSAEAMVHPGLYQRPNGRVHLASIRGPGFGYRLREIRRSLPPAAVDLRN